MIKNVMKNCPATTRDYSSYASRLERLALPLGFLCIGLLAGWLLHLWASSNAVEADRRNCLRQSGYRYISPLLACDQQSDNRSPQLEPLREKLQAALDDEVGKRHVDSASVYYRELNTGESTGVNLQEKFYPASMNKIPVLIAAYKAAERKPGFLQTAITAPTDADSNAEVEVKPERSMAPGSTATVEEALNLMIKYSDNNAFYAMAKALDTDEFTSTFRDLGIPLRQSTKSSPDYLTAKDFAYFYRVLYSSTYLDREYSQRALKLLTQATYKKGLAAGVPSGIEVAHKFGIYTFTDDTGTSKRELHDCGVVYRSQSPYLLCVMTKGSGSLPDSESAIRRMSELVYKEVGTKR